MCRRGSGRREPLMMNGTERLIGLRMRKVTLRKRHWKKPARIAGGCVWFVLDISSFVIMPAPAPPFTFPSDIEITPIP